MAAFYAAGVLSQYPIGKVADRIGRRQVLLAGLVLYGLASFAFLLPIGAAMAIVLRPCKESAPARPRSPPWP